MELKYKADWQKLDIRISTYDCDRYCYCLNEEKKAEMEAKISWVQAAIIKNRAELVEGRTYTVRIPASDSASGEEMIFWFDAWVE